MQTETERQAQTDHDRAASFMIGILFTLQIMMLGMLLWLSSTGRLECLVQGLLRLQHHAATQRRRRL